ncbi:hypothetical protein EDB84DRAFT_1510729 [Lactarius hengduanensis]|nr:hypothetical protein EDB84DRAFT_1510729 [Lactarius hengduanensis]
MCHLFVGSLVFPWFEAQFHRKPDETHPSYVTSHVFSSAHAETIDPLHFILGLVPTYSNRVRREWNRVSIILTDKTLWTPENTEVVSASLGKLFALVRTTFY